VPNYYHSLKPFRKLFQTGTPILTYHKLGPRPPGVRLKGLYIGEKLFTRQLGELRAAGFASGTLETCAAPCANRQLVITFDDGFENALRHGLKPLAENQFRAVQFLVAGRLGQSNEWEQREGEVPELLMDVEQIREWLAAGHGIGSHSLTHPFLTRLSPAAAREEITASRKKLEDMFSRPVEDFCYPYGDWNEAVRDLVMAAGYKTACTINPGVNSPADSPFALKRFTARYPSRNLKAIWSRLSGR
jgi:peptidoglycan/xylan/chitin deacetylase (PgdA/CDA1 family)